MCVEAQEQSVSLLRKRTRGLAFLLFDTTSCWFGEDSSRWQLMLEVHYCYLLVQARHTISLLYFNLEQHFLVSSALTP
jgi:hypothetical protein